ncbi:8-oxo-dGTP diphosphatase MutT [Paraglaciecola aquimarina]|uniref:8-oxo-dGTP diphosphatase n=1 Tax=Paraglaciecola algarum TaxID=3050085 RepID=A0ABS9D6R3_9ALTE|nr:8-oxo-dGTP diphosphatase MutT [Paraglaciecola sp. G1-23]MCF2948590.1 8-oxo-dGTP diphosphatase MutT [Paraglaciecola sp. G1-23]
MKVVDVAVGVIKQGNRIYISKRADDLHQGGKWEFPGGKREPNESIDQALSRELQEEIGIQVKSQTELTLIEHDYGDKKVRLHVRLVDEFSGEAQQQEGQQAKWVAIADLNQYQFPAANVAIIELLQRLVVTKI